MKKITIITCLVITAILNTNKANAQDPYITPDHYSITMYAGDEHNATFYAHNGTIQEVQLLSSMDPDCPITINNQDTFFEITLKAIAASTAARVVGYVLKVLLVGNPYTGLIVFACEIAISVAIAYAIISAPIPHLPLLALISKHPYIKQENFLNFSILKNNIMLSPVYLTKG